MNVANTHNAYATYQWLWRKCRDAVDGEESIKRAGSLYLIPLSSGDNEGYAMRAYFYNATGRTAEALSGLLFVKPPSAEMPASLEEFVRTVGPDQEPLFQMVQTTANELIAVGRVGVLVDAAPESDAPYVTIYRAEDIINWRVERINGRRTPTLVVLREREEVVDDVDPFANEEREIYRVLRLIPSEETVTGWAYQMQTFYYEDSNDNDGKPQRLWHESSVTLPRTNGGKLFDYIPFQFINTNSTTPDCDKPPLIDLVNINLSHYRTTADLEHGRHFTGLPTPYVTGVPDERMMGRDAEGNDRVVGGDRVIHLGSTIVQRFTDPSAKFAFAEFTGAGLTSLERALEQKERQMQVVGGRMLEEQKKAQDRSEAIKLRMVGDSATLSGVADQLSIGWTSLLQMLADWLLIPDAGVRYTVSREFTSFSMDANTMATFMASVQQGLVPWQDFVAAMQRQSFMPSERSIEDTRKLIEEGLPVTPLSLGAGEAVNPNTPEGDLQNELVPKPGVGATVVQ